MNVRGSAYRQHLSAGRRRGRRKCPHCGYCHGGICPTPAEIREQCWVIQSYWSPEEMAKRRGATLVRDVHHGTRASDEIVWYDREVMVVTGDGCNSDND